MSKKYFSNFHSFILDYIIIPFIIILVVYYPNFIHGVIDYFEAGKELACVNEVFLGKIPYRDIFLQFGPLNTYLEAFFMLLFGKSLVVLSAFFYIGNLAGIIIAYLIGRTLCKSRFFSCIIAFLLIVETYAPCWSRCWGGVRFSLALLALLCAIKFFKGKKDLWIILSGIFASTTFLVTTDTGLFSLTAIGFTLCFYTVYNFMTLKNITLKHQALFIIGVLVVLCPFLIYFILQKALIPYITTVITMAKNHKKVLDREYINLWAFLRPSQIFSLGFKRILFEFLYMFFTVYLIRRVVKKKITWRDYSILCLLIYAWLMLKIKASTMREINGAQFQMALQPAIIMGGVFLEGVFKSIINMRGKELRGKEGMKAIVLLSILAFGTVYYIFSEKTFKEWPKYLKCKKQLAIIHPGMIPGFVRLDIDRAKGVVVPLQQGIEIEGITRYIISKTVPGEPVFGFPEMGVYNFFANRPCLDRFNMPTCIWTTPEWGKELLADLKNVRPRYIIYNKDLSLVASTINNKEELFPEIIEYIHSNYEREASFGSIDILRYKWPLRPKFNW